MKARFAVVYEARADLEIATELADRVFIEAINWLESEHLQSNREWVGEHQGSTLAWIEIPKLAEKLNVRAMGHFDGKPGAFDAAASRRALLVLRRLFDDLAGVILIRDQDDKEQRRSGMEQARNLPALSSLPIVIGLAVIEREAWVIAGFEPEGEEQESRLKKVRQELGFDPRLQSHELTAGKDDQAKKSPKRVLKELCGEDRERERRCWSKTPLEVLHARGEQNGLKAFLDEVRERLAPALGRVTDG